MSEQDLQQLNSEGETVESTVNGEAITDNKPKNRKISKFVDILLWVMIAVLAVAVLVRAFVFTQITVSGESMSETFTDKEVVDVSKVKKPTRGDVIVFYKNDVSNKFFDVFASRKADEDGKYSKLIKRCVALAGDKLWVEKVLGATDTYRVVVETPDGETVYEDTYTKDKEVLPLKNFYITGTLKTGSDLGELRNHIGKENAYVVPENCFYVLGDNRNNSSDSRTFGAIPTSRLYGVVINV